MIEFHSANLFIVKDFWILVLDSSSTPQQQASGVVHTCGIVVLHKVITDPQNCISCFSICHATFIHILKGGTLRLLGCYVIIIIIIVIIIIIIILSISV